MRRVLTVRGRPAAALGVCAMFLAVATSGAPAAPPAVTIIDVGINASALNNSGLVVGDLFGCSPCGPKAVAWTQAGGVVDIHTAVGSTSNVSHATAVNDSGEVVGFANDGPFAWNESDGGTMLALPAGLYTTSGSSVTDINASGQFVGGAYPGVGSAFATTHAIIGTRAGGIVHLGTIEPGWSSNAQDINDAGEVVGASSTIAGDPASCFPISGICNREFHAFYWSGSANDEMIDLGTLDGSPGSISGAVAINESGQVVVNSRTESVTGTQGGSSGPTRAFIWTEAGGQLEDIGTLGGDSAGANDINDAGQVVGTSKVASGDEHAFVWTEAGGMQNLGTLGGATSFAADINELGQVVGQSQVASGEYHAFLWTEADGMVDLGGLDGFTYSGAQAINENGLVLGSSGSNSVLWQLGPSGPADTDADGIPDDLDDGAAAPGFTNVVDGKANPTVGTVTSGAVTVTDHADPTKGVRITAVTDAVLSVCPFPTALVLEIPAGVSVTVTCGSVIVEEVSDGPVTVKIPGTTTSVTFAEGSSGTVSTQGGVTVSGVSGGVTLSIGGVSAQVPAGDSKLIQGGSGNTTITGTNGNDVIIDSGGFNTIDAKGGNDSITVSGSGNNTIQGGAGNDSITTGSGNDTLDGGDGNDVINAGNGSNTVSGGKGNDSITAGSGNDNVDGGAGTDACNADGGKNTIRNCEG